MCLFASWVPIDHIRVGMIARTPPDVLTQVGMAVFWVFAVSMPAHRACRQVVIDGTILSPYALEAAAHPKGMCPK